MELLGVLVDGEERETLYIKRINFNLMQSDIFWLIEGETLSSH